MVNNHVPAMEALVANGAQFNFADNVRFLHYRSLVLLCHCCNPWNFERAYLSITCAIVCLMSSDDHGRFSIFANVSMNVVFVISIY